MNMDTINDTPENLASNESDSIETFESETVPIPSFDSGSHRRYFGKLRKLGKIHAEIASQLNTIREAYSEYYVTESPETTNFLGLHLASLKL